MPSIAVPETVSHVTPSVVVPPVLRFPAGLPGFPSARTFAYVPLHTPPFACLRCTDEGGPSFLVTHPAAFFKDYVVSIDDEWQKSLGVESSEDVVVLVIVTMARGEEPTANLLGPIVANVHDGRAGQVVQVGSTYSATTPLAER